MLCVPPSQIVKDNKLEDSITLIHGKLEDIELPVPKAHELPILALPSLLRRCVPLLYSWPSLDVHSCLMQSACPWNFSLARRCCAMSRSKKHSRDR